MLFETSNCGTGLMQTKPTSRTISAEYISLVILYITVESGLDKQISSLSRASSNGSPVVLLSPPKPSARPRS
jgi:hypothetical protein